MSLINNVNKKDFMCAYIAPAMLSVSMLFLAGCASHSDKPIELEGAYVSGPEVSSFQPCNSNKLYWVESNGIIQPLEILAKQLREQSLKNYTPIYIKIKAVKLPPAVDGFAADYDGVIKAVSVDSINGEFPTECKLPI